MSIEDDGSNGNGHEAAAIDGADALDGDAEATMRAATARIETLEAELAQMRDNWVRSEAEMQNVRARTRRDVEDARQFAVQKFAGDVVEAAENLRRGLASLPAATQGDADPLVGKLRDGFEGVHRSFLALLERNGIVGTDPTGTRFDANLHQAMAEQDSAEPSGTVIAAWTTAWTLNGRLLKPAMVVVSKGGPATGHENDAVAGAASGGNLDTNA